MIKNVETIKVFQYSFLEATLSTSVSDHCSIMLLMVIYSGTLLYRHRLNTHTRM